MWIISEIEDELKKTFSGMENWKSSNYPIEKLQFAYILTKQLDDVTEDAIMKYSLVEYVRLSNWA
jgi:hypothetical protein